MRKQIKYSASLIIIILSLILGFTVSAENNTQTSGGPVACTMDAKACGDGSFVGRVGPNCEFAKCPATLIREDINNQRDLNRNELEKLREANQQKMQQERGLIRENRTETKNVLTDELQAKREAYKTKMNQMMEIIKTNREELRKELDLRKEEVKQRIEVAKSNLKEYLSKIKDENKKLSTEKILENINKININKTDNFLNKTDQIENVLLSIKSRISKVENKIIDASTMQLKISDAEKAIALAREDINKQSSKTYLVSTVISDEAALKSEILKLRDEFHADIVKLNNEVKLAHSAVSDVAVLLAKTPNVNEDSISSSVEDNTSTNN